jgi:hypothetical protein|tara:strand:- start:236 stop:571 length:336 start_codon:yes stop_codon:yes gene_type:complete
MSTLINASIKTSELKKIDKNKIIKGEKDSYIPITISVNDESRYGKNVSITIAQDQDERSNKAEKHYLGNGSVIWTDGKVLKGQKEDDNAGGNQSTNKSSSVSNDDMNDLPF